MAKCPGCGRELPSDGFACPVCDAGTQLSTDASRRADVGPLPPSSLAASIPAASDSGEPAPGSLFAQRYRIIGLLGRGGMGSVWRADDLKLGQSVALKFLPDSLRRDPDRVQRFLAEVRNAREVSHPNVCRVYDVGEEDDRLFLSMEYVDGEDLSILLRRIGRLPQEKALDIARQLCAGLAALHDRGLLHRDLKPANVMLDGRGRVRLTDFGLAAFAEGLDRREVRSGTPQYMAPEQLAGEDVSPRSDVYALGLVLYEVFTGRAAFQADSLEELQQMHSSATPSRLSTHVTDVDPAIDRVIARCLEKDPAHRPPSAIAVSTALPGGDPLAAALAMGETPSPELVAAAGGRGGLHPWVAVLLCALGVAGIALHLDGGRSKSLPAYYDLDRPAAAYEERARDLVADLGYDPDPIDRAHGFARFGSALAWHAERDSSVDRWDRLADLRPDGMAYWYRQSPQYLIPRDATDHVYMNHPPANLAGMVEVTTEISGRLLRFEAIPPEEAAAADSALLETRFDRLFEEAALDRADFTAIESTWIPDVHADARRAWRGAADFDSSITLVIEAGSVGDRPTSFRVTGPWTRPARTVTSPREGSAAEASIVVLVVVVMGGAIALAYRNVRRHRGDVQRAFVVATIMTLAPILRWVFSLHHVPLPSELFEALMNNLGMGLTFGVMCVAFYLAVEPFTRRVWPESLIAWNRVMAGQLTDPMVGRSVLIGFASLSVGILMELLVGFVQGLTDEPPSEPSGVNWMALRSAASMFGEFANQIPNAIFNALFFLVLMSLVRMVVKARWATYIVFVAMLTAIIGVQNPPLAVGLSVGLLLALTWTFVLVRFGLLAFTVGFLAQNFLNQYPVTLRFDQMHTGPSLLSLGVMLVAIVASAIVATSGHRPPGDRASE